MKRLTLAIMTCVFTLAATAARADDGGWLEWLYRLDPKFVGIGSDIHLLCLDKDKKPMKCEEWFLIPRLLKHTPISPDDAVRIDELKHQIDFRFGFFWKYGERFPDVSDTRSIKALKLMVMYNYQADEHIMVGFGMGFMPFFPEGAPAFSRGILTPISVTYGPFTSGNIARKSFILKAESTYITQGLSGADFGNPNTRYANNGEWNFSVSTGFDFRRRNFR